MRQFSQVQFSVGYLFNPYWFWTTACNEEGPGQKQETAVGSLYLFEHESTEGSCMYLGFSENSITLAADTLLRNTNKNGNGNKGLEFELLGDEGWSSARYSCPNVEECPGMFSRRTHGPVEDLVDFKASCNST